ncbi:hypothetical protein BDV96DRAFT_672734 [Lophiotrema nucula]|uniref:DUF6604 domain-containing protein n=1 Tax=Lophiotrema nucula TaxID=690887 RepID=A0A6A5YNX5_9PLEO|nr:hypothetical protein BDV96DRAFT_672734 [Lophiotrema nucula]
MGLPSDLADTYQRYKRGTKHFVQWLAKTARSTGTVEELFIDKSAGSDKSTKRSKGKNRNTTKKQPRSYEIPLNNFVHLAKVVAAGTGIEVPAWSLVILRDTIRARRSCLDWYLANQSETDETKKAHNDGHQYFITILEKVMKLLEPKVKDCKEDLANDKAQAANIYDNLPLEESSESGTSEWLPFIPGHTPKPKEKPTSYEMESTKEDVSFAIYCFMKDVTDVRLFIRRTWREYKKGEVTLQTAALCMNAGIRQIRTMDENFRAAFPNFKDHVDLNDFIFGEYCDKNPASIFGGREMDEDYMAYESGSQKLPAATVFCWHTTEFAMRFVIAKNDPVYKHDPSLRLSKDEIIMVKCLSQLVLLVKRIGDNMMRDQVLKAVAAMRKDSVLYTWTVLAVQIFWDTRTELKNNTSLGLKTLRSCGEWISKSYGDYLALDNSDNLGTWHRVNRETMVHHKEEAENYTMSDIVGDIMESLPKERRQMYDHGSFFLFRQHPAMCGLFVEYLLVDFHITAIGLSGSQLFVTTVAHLYNAAHQSGYLAKQVQWADMDWFIEMHGEAHLFIGKRPDQRQDFKTRLAIAFGTSAKEFAKDFSYNRAGPRITRGKNRRLLHMSVYALALIERTDRKGKPIAVTKTGQEVAAMTEKIVQDYLNAEEKENTDKRKSKPSTLTALETLGVFKNAVRKDELVLQFDMLSLYLRCVKLLRSIGTDCLQHVPQAHLVDGDNEYLALTGIGQMLLEDLAFAPIPPMSRFPHAAQMLRTMIEKEGDSERKLADFRVANCKFDPDIEQEDEIDDLGFKFVHGDENGGEASMDIPPETLFPLELRSMFSSIIIQDDNGNIHMPFGP